MKREYHVMCATTSLPACVASLLAGRCGVEVAFPDLHVSVDIIPVSNVS
jgi:hypothetical protein